MNRIASGLLNTVGYLLYICSNGSSLCIRYLPGIFEYKWTAIVNIYPAHYVMRPMND